jgi:hypothetical protein
MEKKSYGLLCYAKIIRKIHIFNVKYPLPANLPINPNVTRVGGLQSQGAKGEAVVNLLRTLGNTGSGVLRLFPQGKQHGIK